MGLWAAGITGLLAGATHVFAGPDHLAAVAPLSIENSRRSGVIGLLWGVGHSGGVWVVAAVALAFREALPLEAVSAWSERAVGVVLIGVGLWGIHRVLRTRVHSHVHEHDGVTHAHVHAHVDGAHNPHPHRHNAHTHSALGIGALHGLAGTAHVIAVLPALLIPSSLEAIVFLLSFGIGSIVAMMAFSSVMGAIARRSSEHSTRTYRVVALSSCTAAVCVGVWWCWMTFGTAVAHSA
jgi:sulfite exporter TauE/SafE